MSGASLLPDQVYDEDAELSVFKSPSKFAFGNVMTNAPAARGQSYEDNEIGTSASPSSCSSGCDIDGDGGCDGGDHYGREMRSLLESLENALGGNDFIVGRGFTSERVRRRRRRGDEQRVIISESYNWLTIRPDFFCQYPRLLEAASKGSRTASVTLRLPQPGRAARSASADRALVLPVHRAAGGGAGRARQAKITRGSAGSGGKAMSWKEKQGGAALLPRPMGTTEGSKRQSGKAELKAKDGEERSRRRSGRETNFSPARATGSCLPASQGPDSIDKIPCPNSPCNISTLSMFNKRHRGILTNCVS